ncbi:putative lipoprotein [Staphylococcus aureus]|uniref:Putative lipoprotein n=1 Tax=Staphylococcus aureus TaxID=1280 RepID=A0A2X2K1K1_STAAU|nr:putative lipoprotein [Staphylococcus aureus]
MDNFGLKVKATNVVGSGDGVEVSCIVMTTTSYLMRVFI